MTPANQKRSSDGAPTEWWFNTRTNKVEFGKLSAAPYRLGPFQTESEAEQALALIAERSRKWRESEQRED
jgi:hypothetical protein